MGLALTLAMVSHTKIGTRIDSLNRLMFIYLIKGM
jgi:hypothetical protein